MVDRLIRAWRVNEAFKYLPFRINSILDIGCDDGYVLNKLDGLAVIRDGVDPRVDFNADGGGAKLYRGFFPEVIETYQLKGPYDVIFALAVFEHFSEHDLAESSRVISRILSPGGRLIVTIPHPFVDRILDFLLLLKLIDGQAVEEHHGFNPKDLENSFSTDLKLTIHAKFQFGLNNIYVFERI